MIQSLKEGVCSESKTAPRVGIYGNSFVFDYPGDFIFRKHANLADYYSLVRFWSIIHPTYL